jgi:aminomethyltransferase
MTGYQGLRQQAAWIDLSRRGKIRVSGEDRARLLHAMSTNDIKNLAPGEGLYAFFLSDKGRILADAVIYNRGESLFLDTEPEAAEKLRDHLDRYIIADDAFLEDEGGQWDVIGVEGPASGRMLASAGLPIPEKQYSTADWDAGFVAHVASAATVGFRVFVPPDKRDELIEKLEGAGAAPASAEEARIVRIENGVARYGEEITERYLVQETGALHAVHSNKGCYLGQEIVERVRSRGQVHRVLAPVSIRGITVPEPGTKLLAHGEPAAEIASAVFSPAVGEVVGLAYVRTQAVHERPEMTTATDPSAAAYIR